MKRQAYVLIGLLFFLLVASQLTISVNAEDIDVFYSTTKDGYIRHNGADWLTIRNAGTGTSVDDDDLLFGAFTQACHYGATNKWITRSWFYFDTSELEGVIITNVTLHIYGITHAGSIVTAQKGTQAATLTTADYDSFSGNEYGHVTWAINQYNIIEFNEQGRTDIVKDGVTKICVREYTYDYTGDPPINGDTYDGAYYAEQTGTDKDPYLEVTWELAKKTVTFYNSSGGQIELDGEIIANGTTNDYDPETNITLKAYPDGGIAFKNWTWNENSDVSNPYNLTVSDDYVVWCHFETSVDYGGLIGLTFILAIIAITLAVAFMKHRNQ